MCLVACDSQSSAETNNKLDNEALSQAEQETEDDVSNSWSNGIISDELANDIQNALIEIGVTNKLKGLYLDETRETDLFVLRIYKLETTMLSYWIWTREWREGEPEYDTYPLEYMTAIKDWHPDGHMGTNLWDVDGTGSEQTFSASTYLD